MARDDGGLRVCGVPCRSAPAAAVFPEVNRRPASAGWSLHLTAQPASVSIARRTDGIGARLTACGFISGCRRRAIAILFERVGAIEDFKVQTAAYSAEYGFSGGAQVQMVM